MPLFWHVGKCLVSTKFLERAFDSHYLKKQTYTQEHCGNTVCSQFQVSVPNTWKTIGSFSHFSSVSKILSLPWKKIKNKFKRPPLSAISLYLTNTCIFLSVTARTAIFIYLLFFRVPTMCVTSRSPEQTEPSKQEGELIYTMVRNNICDLYTRRLRELRTTLHPLVCSPEKDQELLLGSFFKTQLVQSK